MPVKPLSCQYCWRAKRLELVGEVGLEGIVGAISCCVVLEVQCVALRG
jgi:hypothetical protein